MRHFTEFLGVPSGVPAHRFRPQVLGLEARELLATAVTTLIAEPQILNPPNNRFVVVEVSGTVIETRNKVTPSVRFQVSDEYRLFEPGGAVRLTRIPGVNAWTYRFKITLQASRSSQDVSGRQYSLLVGTSDLDNSQGITKPILVPYQTLKPGQVPKSTVEKPTKAQLRALPPVSSPTTSNATSGIPIFGNFLNK